MLEPTKNTFLVEEFSFANGADEWGRHGVRPHHNDRKFPSPEEMETCIYTYSKGRVEQDQRGVLVL